MKKVALLTIAALTLASCAGRGNPITPYSASQSNAASNSSLSSGIAVDGTVADVGTLNFPGEVSGRADAGSAFLRAGGATTVLAGPLYPVDLACLETAKRLEASAASLNAPPYFVGSGTVRDVLTSTRSSTSAGMTATSTVQGLSVLSGLITATAVKAEANSTGDGSGATSNENGSQFTNLIVAGNHISANVAPNTTITLPGVGRVVLNEVIGPVNGTSTHIAVNMIHVLVTTSGVPGVQAGTNIIVASAASSFAPQAAPFAPSANAYSLYVKGLAGNINATSGPWAQAMVGCEPGSDTARLASASTPIGTLGTMVNTVTTTNTSGASSARADSNTASTNLLGGLITASTIVSRADANRSGSTFTHSGSAHFVALKIAGAALGANVPPNTKITLAGLGYVIVNDEAGTSGKNSAFEEVNGLLVVVTTSNSYNLPIGAEIIVGHSRAQIRGY